MKFRGWAIDGLPSGIMQSTLRTAAQDSISACAAACADPEVYPHAAPIALMVAGNLLGLAGLTLTEREFIDEVQAVLNVAHEIRRDNLSVVGEPDAMHSVLSLVN